MVDETGPIHRTNPHALMHLKNVCSLIGVSRSTLHRLREKDTTFPAPIKDGDTRQAPVYFVQAEVEGWIRKKMNGRHAASNET
jgi:predicted DNA-binding transcriptional regulator AlpA